MFRKISPDAKDLIRNMLMTDPRKRLTATEALKHRWITGSCHADIHAIHLDDVIANFKHQNERRRR